MGDDVLKAVQKLADQDGVADSLMMGMTMNGIVVAIFFGIIGMGYFSYGKKASHPLIMICGAVLMGFPYFVSKTLHMSLIGAGVSLLPLLIRKLR